jgi:hypothetical protein
MPEAERAEILAQICADDETLRREVESLLAACNQAGSFLAHPVFARALLSGAERASLNTRLYVNHARMSGR